MIDAVVVQSDLLDIPTLVFAAACVAAFLGVLLLVTWMQQRDVQAFAWWGAAYLIGASGFALWATPAPLFRIPAFWSEALIVIACGMIWSGVRLFHGRPLLPIAAFSGAMAWLLLYPVPDLREDSQMRIGVGAVIVAIYTFFIAFELLRERRKSIYSRTAAVLVPLLYAGIFLMPLAMRAFLPNVFAEKWLTVFVLETIIYAVGTAFIVLLMVKNQHVHLYRKAAATDNLTGLLNRSAFLEAARRMQSLQGRHGDPVTLMMFDLDHFKSVNDRFGHAAGDSVLRVFAQVAQASMRASDIIGRLGGEEFVAIVPEPMEGALTIAERLRAAFEAAGIMVDNVAIGATVSIGLAASCRATPDIDGLLMRADEALYQAKNRGRNRFCCAEDESESRQNGHAAAVLVPDILKGDAPQPSFAARRPKASDPAPAG